MEQQIFLNLAHIAHRRTAKEKSLNVGAFRLFRRLYGVGSSDGREYLYFLTPANLMLCSELGKFLPNKRNIPAFSLSFLAGTKRADYVN